MIYLSSSSDFYSVSNYFFPDGVGIQATLVSSLVLIYYYYTLKADLDLILSTFSIVRGEILVIGVLILILLDDYCLVRDCGVLLLFLC